MQTKKIKQHIVDGVKKAQKVIAPVLFLLRERVLRYSPVHRVPALDYIVVLAFPKILKLIPILLLMLWSSGLHVPPSVHAATGINETLNFHGRLRTTAGGVVADNNYNMQFHIYSGGDGDPDTADETLEWTGTHLNGNSDAVRVQNGFFNVQLGTSTSQVNTMADVDWNNDTLWLSINVGDTSTSTTCSTETDFNTNCGGDGEMDPFQRLTAVPYAFNANLLDGLDSSELGQLAADQTWTGDNIFQPTANSTSSFAAQNTAGANILNIDSTNGELEVGATNTLTGKLVLNNATNAHSISIQAPNQTTGSATISLPDTAGANDTFCVVTLNNCTGAGANSVGTLDSQTKSADGAVISNNTLYLQSADASNPGLVTTGSQTFAGAKTFNGNLTVTATKTLTLTGGTTANRPASPSEGEMYFDTDTDTLLTYANGKWQAARGDTVIVAASDSSQAEQDSADYVADGTDDQVEINNALTEASGGIVYLTAGTYTTHQTDSGDATISIPNNTTLAGAGKGTVIELGDIDANDVLIANTDMTTGTGVTIRDLRLDGRKDLNTAGSQYGIYLDNIGSGTGTSSVAGAYITNVLIENFRDDGIFTWEISNSVFTDSSMIDNSNYGVNVNYSNNTNITDSLLAGNNSGVNLNESSRTLVSNNQINGNNSFAIYSYFSPYTTITDNLVDSNDEGVYLDTTEHSVVSSNTISNQNFVGMYIAGSSHDNVVSDNVFYDNGGTSSSSAIWVNSSNGNSITGNSITDTAGTGYAIEINSGSNNYLADNNYSGTGAATISDAGTNTIYGGQLAGSSGSDYVLQPTGNVGIGTTSPNTILEVKKDQNSNTELRVNNATAGSGTGAATSLQFYEGSTQKFAIFSPNSGSSSYTGGANSVQLWNYLNGPMLFATNNTEQLRIAANGKTGLGTTTPDSHFQIGGNLSASAWGTTGIVFDTEAATFTDNSTASSGTASSAVFNSFQTPTLSATNTSVTTTDASTVYIQGAPTAGTNQTITNAYALWVDDGTSRFDGHILPGTDDTYDLGSSANRWRDLYLGPQSFHIGTSTSNESQISYDTTNNTLEVQGQVDSTESFQIQNAAGDVIFNTDTTNGYVGIGTNTPTANLHVAGGTLLNDGFEDNTLSPFTTSGDASWATTSGYTNTGTYSAKAGTITHSQTTTMEITKTLDVADTIEFAARVSSEEGWDYFTFYIDSTEKLSLSGEQNWQTYEYSVSSGTHTFKWEYSKDGSVSEGSDTAWIDDVVLYKSSYIAGMLGGGITPTVDNKYSLGTSQLRWKDLYLGPNSLHIGNSTSETKLNFDTTNNTLEVAPTINSNQAFQVQNKSGSSVFNIGTRSVKDLTQVDNLSTNDLNGARNIDISGDYAYVASDRANSLTVINISEPTNLNQVGTTSSTDLDGAQSVYVSGNYAYVASYSADSLTVIDISTPSSPTQVGTISNTNLDGAYDVHVSGNHAYVTGYIANTLVVIDISTPSSPTQVGVVSTTELEGAQYVYVDGNYAYVMSFWTETYLAVIDISTPSSPTQVNAITSTADGTSDIVISGDYAYVASGDSDTLTVFDLSSPTSPSQVGTVISNDISNEPGLYVAGNYAYVVSRSADSLVVIDITDPTKPTQSSVISDSVITDLSSPYDVHIDGGYAYVANDFSDSVTVIEIGDAFTGTAELNGEFTVKDADNEDVLRVASDNQTPKLTVNANITQKQVSLAQIGTTSTTELNGAQGVFVSGNYAYLTSHWTDGYLSVVDISDKKNPSQVGSLTNANLNGAQDVHVSGNYAYVASENADSLTAIDISTPSSPTQVDSISSTADLEEANGVYVSGNYAYVASKTSDSLTVIDISSPSNLTQVGTTSTTDLNGAQDVFVSGNYAYVVSNFADALTIIDISTPSNPTQVGTISTTELDGASSIYVEGGYAYVASSIADSLVVIDISTPSSPTQVGSLTSTNLDNANGVSVNGSLAHVVSTTSDSLTIIDISDPTDPGEVETLSNTNLDGAIAIYSDNNYAYTANRFADSLTIVSISGSGFNTTLNQLKVQNNATFLGNVGIGTTSPSAKLQVAGDVLFKNASDTTTAFQVQNAAGNEIFTVDTTNTKLVVGKANSVAGKIELANASNSNTISLDTGTTTSSYNLKLPTSLGSSGDCLKLADGSGTLTFGTCDPAGTAQVTLAPEYGGATLTPDGSNNEGTMASDFCSGSGRLSINTGVCSSASDEHNYYEWTTTNGSAQDYDVYVRWQLPSDFSSLSSVNMYGWRTDSTDELVELTLFDSAGTQCGSGNVATGTASWTENAVSMSGCSFSADDTVTFRIKLTSGENDYARAGEIRINYATQ